MDGSQHHLLLGGLGWLDEQVRLLESLSDPTTGDVEVFGVVFADVFCYISCMRKKRTSPIKIVCAHCGSAAKMHSYRIKNGTGKYCGQRCYLAARWGGNGKCRQCGGICETQFCTPSCQTTYWNKHGAARHKHPRNWARKMEIIHSLGGKCSACGFDDIRAIDIDHIDRSKKVKKFKTGWNWSRRFSDWAANVGNLRLLCANCHRLHTWEQRGFGRGLRSLDEKIRLSQSGIDSFTCD